MKMDLQWSKVPYILVFERRRRGLDMWQLNCGKLEIGDISAWSESIGNIYAAILKRTIADNHCRAHKVDIDEIRKIINN